MNKAILVAAMFMLAPLPAFAQETQRPAAGEAKESATPSKEGEREDFLNRLSKTALRERFARAVEVVGRACRADIEELCGDVPPGGGRIARCLKENEDDLSPRCRVALYVVSRRIANNVRNITSACWSDVQSQCGDAENFKQCVMQKRESFSPACKTVVAALRETAQVAAAILKGMPVYSADDRNLGQVVEVTRGPDGKVQSVQIQIGRFLGIGDKVVTIDSNQLQRLADRIKLRLDSDQVRALPQARRTQ